MQGVRRPARDLAVQRLRQESGTKGNRAGRETEGDSEQKLLCGSTSPRRSFLDCYRKVLENGALLFQSSFYSL